MKKMFSACVCGMLMIVSAFGGATSQSAEADAICGEWVADYGGAVSYIKISKSADGTYKGQVYKVSEPLDEKGNKVLDTKNPDKSLRNVPIDQVVLFNGLKYDKSSGSWGDTKIYDPTRGIRANMTARLNGKTLNVKGKILGIGESVTWTRKQS